ncbi:hypothetical protein [Candidatus Halobonum tyrrellensis]|uniref:Uncharacterized protein n=1 Tax=Candidatus Halobonum tyrrellensis G22 TaxID=1324957 RepID=V4HE63_9EURY|nr:hypothetical protein K933_09427 [Candidatus Halobonum tyrrellensis G22]
MGETDEPTDSGGDDGLFTRGNLLLALVLFVGVAGTGVVRRELGVLGYNELGRIVFILGYGGTVLVVWLGWIRPLDITGPTGNVGSDEVDGPYGAADDGGAAGESESNADANAGADANTGTDADAGTDGGTAEGAGTAGAERDATGRTER